MARSALPSIATPARRRWVGWGALALMVVGLGVGGWYANRAWQRSEERSAALALANAGRRDEAIPALRQCLDRDPDDTELLEAIVVALARSGAAATKVEPYLDRLCTLRPDDADARVIRLDLLTRFGRQEEALADARRILELRPDDTRTRHSAATLALNLGHYEEAERDVLQLLESSRQSKPELGTMLARARRGRGDRAGAEAALGQYVPPGTDFNPAQVLRGILLYDAERYDEAARLLQAAVPQATGSDRRDALYHLALTLTRLGKADEARKLFDQLDQEYRLYRLSSDANLRLDDMPAQVRAARGNLDAGKPDEAVRILEPAIARLGPDRDALLILADCYDRLGRPDQAVAARRRATTPVP